MKSLVESIKINEAREIEYCVAFAGVKDSEDLPYTVKILVPAEHKRDFINYLNREEMNSILHAEGPGVEF